MPKKGKWIVIEGIDGSGKSTLAKAIKGKLEAMNVQRIVSTGEPTNGPYGSMFRSRMKEYLNGGPIFGAVEQLQVLTRDRTGHLGLVRQELEDGAIVVQDRSWHSTIAYQGQTLAHKSLIDMHNWLYDPGPDLVVFVDIPLKDAFDRLAARGDDDAFQSMIGKAFDLYQLMYLKYRLFDLRVSGLLTTELQAEAIISKLMDLDEGEDDLRFSIRRQDGSCMVEGMNFETAVKFFQDNRPLFKTDCFIAEGCLECHGADAFGFVQGDTSNCIACDGMGWIELEDNDV